MKVKTYRVVNESQDNNINNSERVQMPVLLYNFPGVRSYYHLTKP